MRLAIAIFAMASMAAWPPVASVRGAQDYGTVMRRLEPWTRAVDAHEPGALDEGVREIGAWPATRLVGAVGLVRELATHADVDDLVRRGAMLHLDAVVLGVARTIGPVPQNLRRPGLESVDARGEQQGLASIHLTSAQLLLDEITPRARDDDVARLWYRATTAWLAAAYKLTDLKAHLEKAASVFGNDAVTTFDRGCLYETFASRRVRAIIDTTAQQTFTFDVPTRRASLTEASRHFRRAVELNPEMVDARLRLGRVLVLIGREDDGVTELQRALAATSRPEWQYDASLMLGRAAEARGRLDAARQWFEAAEALYSRAQAPKLALARLASAQGDGRQQADRVSAALSLERERQQDDDPWWTYHQGIGRDASDLLERLRRRVREVRR